jgi:hypothetical protein
MDMTTEHLRNIRIENLPLVDLVPDPRNARLHSKSQLDILSRAIKSFWVQ